MTSTAGPARQAKTGRGASGELMIRVVFLLVFIAIPLLELAVLIRVGQHIGVAATIGIVVATAILGLLVVRREGLSMVTRARQALATGNPPIMPVAEGALVFLSGALLILPGLIGDSIGIVLLIPPVRRAVAVWALGRFATAGATRIRIFTSGERRPDRRNGGSARPQKPGPIIEGEYTRIDDADDEHRTK